MRAIVYKKYGSPEVLHLKGVENSTPDNNEVVWEPDERETLWPSSAKVA